MENQLAAEKALSDALQLQASFSKLQIEAQLRYKTQPTFTKKKDEIQCFLGTIPSQNGKRPVMGCIQTYYIENQELDDKIFWHETTLSQLMSKTSTDKYGFEFIPIRAKNNKGETIYYSVEDQDATNNQAIGVLLEKQWLKFKILLHSFYQVMPSPTFFKSLMSKKYPMSIFVVMSPLLNQSLYSAIASENPPTYFAYAFTNEKSGPDFWGFGPGKFESGFKHYAAVKVDEKTLKVTLTALISPRSNKVLNIFGIDPFYGTARLLDVLTFQQFKIFKKVKNRMELFMMEHHAKVHEQMLEVLFAKNTEL